MSRMVPKEVIIVKKAKKYIEKGYCKGHWARDRRGCALEHWDNPKAAAWCAQGALYKAAMSKNIYMSSFRSALVEVERTLEKQTGNLRSILAWNDRPETSKEDVLALFDATILSFGENK